MEGLASLRRWFSLLLWGRSLPRTDLYILCAAIYYDDGKARIFEDVETGIVLCGHRHHVITQTLCENYGQAWRNSHTQGFLTSTGAFVGRTEGMVIARAAGQTISRNAKLYSEDLYLVR